LLIEGRVKVSQVSKNGSEVILWLNVPGQTIGSLNLTPGYAHSSTAEAVQDCKVLVWELPMFEASLERFPPLFRNVQAIMVRQIDELSRRICEISTGTVAPRLAHGLLRLIGQIGREVNGDVELNLTQETLAEMTATTFYTVCRQLAEWERRGLVFRRKYTIVIRDLSGLRRLCGNSTISPS
jgi:CRP-like cAMP-binding protein